jgi:CubicO group peptidase (beta-lactamase class C family)
MSSSARGGHDHALIQENSSPRSRFRSVGVLRTTVPAVSRDVDFFPGTKLKWGFGHMITTQPVPEGRSAGSLTWAGIYNTYYWLDPKKRIAAVFMTQVLPFADERVLGVYRRFERGIYAAVNAGYVKAG